MSSLNSIFPISSKDQYSENDIVDFLLSFDNKMIVANSIRVSGNVVVTDTNGDTVYPLASSWKIDGDVGIAGAFQSITSSCDMLGVIENQNEHGRYVKAKTGATQTRQQRATDTLNAPELKSFNDLSTAAILSGAKYGDGQHFSWKPECALNKSTSHIPFKKTGACKLSLRLATNNMFVFGVAAGMKYTLSNLKLEYLTVPDAPLKQPLVFETIHMIKSTADSQNSSIGTRVPAVAQSVSIVFHREDQLNQPLYNHYALEVPPDIQRVEFSFNDSLTNYHTFALDSLEEILYNYQMSWGASAMGKSDIRLSLLNVNENYGVGVPFGQFLDLTKTKFGINILSNIKNDSKYGVFMFFRGILKV